MAGTQLTLLCWHTAGTSASTISGQHSPARGDLNEICSVWRQIIAISVQHRGLGGTQMYSLCTDLGLCSGTDPGLCSLLLYAASRCINIPPHPVVPVRPDGVLGPRAQGSPSSLLALARPGGWCAPLQPGPSWSSMTRRSAPSSTTLSAAPALMESRHRSSCACALAPVAWRCHRTRAAWLLRARTASIRASTCPL